MPPRAAATARQPSLHGPIRICLLEHSPAWPEELRNDSHRNHRITTISPRALAYRHRDAVHKCVSDPTYYGTGGGCVRDLSSGRGPDLASLVPAARTGAQAGR